MFLPELTRDYVERLRGLGLPKLDPIWLRALHPGAAALCGHHVHEFAGLPLMETLLEPSTAAASMTRTKLVMRGLAATGSEPAGILQKCIVRRTLGSQKPDRPADLWPERNHDRPRRPHDKSVRVA